MQQNMAFKQVLGNTYYIKTNFAEEIFYFEF